MISLLLMEKNLVVEKCLFLLLGRDMSGRQMSEVDKSPLYRRVWVDKSLGRHVSMVEKCPW